MNSPAPKFIRLFISVSSLLVPISSFLSVSPSLRFLAVCFLFPISSLLVPSSLYASKLDLSSEVKIKHLSYKNATFDPLSGSKENFITQEAALGFILKNIILEKSLDSSMDVGIVFYGIGIAGSTYTVKTPFNKAAEQYPNTAMIPFIREAYIKVYKAFGKNLTMTMGRQMFTLGSGMLLSSNPAGFTGARLEFN